MAVRGGGGEGTRLSTASTGHPPTSAAKSSSAVPAPPRALAGTTDTMSIDVAGPAGPEPPRGNVALQHM
jgi:hypothetical protein